MLRQTDAPRLATPTIPDRPPSSRPAEDAPAAALVLSPRGDILSWNTKAQELLTLSSLEARGRALSQFLADPQGARDALEQLNREDGVQSVCLTVNWIPASRDPLPLVACFDALRGNGGVEGVRLTVRDRRTHRYQAPTAVATAREAALLESLTPRQRLVLELIARGSSTRGIAQQMERSIKTVETHRALLMERLDIHTVAGLVRFAIRTGLVPIA